jgi:hypothetical protein
MLCPECGSANLTVFGEQIVLVVERTASGEAVSRDIVGWGERLGSWQAMCPTCRHAWRLPGQAGIPPRFRRRSLASPLLAALTRLGLRRRA